MKQSVKLISITPEAEKLIMYCARVSNPKHQDSEDYKLLKYCAEKEHWSIFEMAHMVVEVNTSRIIGRQLIRHKSMSFQEFSGRYQNINELSDDDKKLYMEFKARSQDKKNRQNSNDDMDENTIKWFNKKQEWIYNKSMDIYNAAIKKGIAKEQARAVLPQNAATRIYAAAPLRTWITYLNTRLFEAGAQLEHIKIAEMIKDIFLEELPIISEAFGFFKYKNKVVK